MTAPDSVERVVAEMRRRAGCLPAVSDWAGVVEEELHDWMKRLQALARGNRASGSHPDALPDGTFSKSTVKRRRVLQQAGGEDVQRFAPKVTPNGKTGGLDYEYMAKTPDGSWARHTDYAALQAEVARLLGQNERLASAVRDTITRAETAEAALRGAGRDAECGREIAAAFLPVMEAMRPLVLNLERLKDAASKEPR